MSLDLTEAQAREEFQKLSYDEVKAYAIAEGKPTEGFSKNDLIELLLGHCVGCKKGKMTLIIISANKQTIIKQNEVAPCKECGK